MHIAVMSADIRERIPDIRAYLLIVFGFVLPLSVSIGNIVAVFIAALWLIDGKFDDKVKEITGNKVALAFIAFFMLNVIGLLWTNDMKWGLHILGKHWKLLLMPILMTSIRREHIPYYIEAFIGAMTIAHAVSYLNIAGLINVSVSSRITYNVLLAFTTYLLLNRLLFYQVTGVRKFTYILLFTTMSINLFITDGRMGWVAYFALLCLIVFQYFSKHLLRAAILSAIILPVSVMLLYGYSNSFRVRMDGTWKGFTQFKIDNPPDEVCRLTFYINSLEIFKKHPLVGIGTGDFPAEYKKTNAIHSPKYVEIVQPHSNYLLVLVQFGLIGFIVFMSIFYFQIKCSFSVSAGDFPLNGVLQEPGLRHLMLALPLFFLIIMFTDSYLLGHYTTLLFTYFSAFLYKGCNEL